VFFVSSIFCGIKSFSSPIPNISLAIPRRSSSSLILTGNVLVEFTILDIFAI
jgi:hypothetical protein